MHGAPDILLVEDDPSLTALVTEYLGLFDMQVRSVERGADALHAVRSSPPDLVLLDVGLPDMSGFDVCRAIRQVWSGPVVFLTARAGTTDEVLGLDLGADDYLRKPIQPAVLLARIRARLRVEAAPKAPRLVTLGRLEVDADRRETRVDGEVVPLTSGEFDLLWELAVQAGTPVAREVLFETLRGIPWDGLDRTVDVRVLRVRRKLGPMGDLLRSVRGVGYLLAPPR